MSQFSWNVFISAKPQKDGQLSNDTHVGLPVIPHFNITELFMDERINDELKGRFRKTRSTSTPEINTIDSLYTKL